MMSPVELILSQVKNSDDSTDYASYPDGEKLYYIAMNVKRTSNVF